jgi:hypothetical protein
MERRDRLTRFSREGMSHRSGKRKGGGERFNPVVSPLFS